MNGRQANTGARSRDVIVGQSGSVRDQDVVSGLIHFAGECAGAQDQYLPVV